MITKRNNCRLCKSKKLELCLHLNESSLANSFVNNPEEKQETYPLDLYRCLNCSHYQILDIIDPEVLFKNYLYVSGTSSLMREHFKNYAESVVSELELKEKSFVVEIGSNDATLLSYFKALGMDVLGVDPAENLAKDATERGYTTMADFFDLDLAEKISYYYGKADVICANNVFAHSDNLEDIVLGVKELLKDTGVFIFEVSYFKNVLETNDFSQIYHEHTSYHHLYPLIQFFEKFNMAITNVEKIETHGGSIRCYVIKGITNKDLHIIDHTSLLKKEANFGMNNGTAIKDFSKRIEKVKEELREELLKLKDSGKKICGVAASAKSTTFLHHFEIGKEILNCIYDDAPEKQGKYSPGLHIPIKSFSELENDKPDYLLNLSFNFSQFLIDKHKDYKGKWIIPLPFLEIR